MIHRLLRIAPGWLLLSAVPATAAKLGVASYPGISQAFARTSAMSATGADCQAGDGRSLEAHSRAGPMANHPGDLCIHAGRVHVAANLWKFNAPGGRLIVCSPGSDFSTKLGPRLLASSTHPIWMISLFRGYGRHPRSRGFRSKPRPAAAGAGASVKHRPPSRGQCRQGRHGTSRRRTVPPPGGIRAR